VSLATTAVLGGKKTDEARLTALHEEYAPVLLGYLAGFTNGNRPAAEDLLQETMIRAWCNLESLPTEPEHTRRWLFTVARHVAIDAIRRRRARPVEVDALDSVPAQHADETTDTVVALESLRRALGSLSTDHRVILAEIYLKGSSTAEAAERLGVPVGTVKSRAHYALRSLRTAIVGAR
jgi:RNA polymerase sigma-70 factor (ECF subfamily)